LLAKNSKNIYMSTPFENSFGPLKMMTIIRLLYCIIFFFRSTTSMDGKVVRKLENMYRLSLYCTLSVFKDTFSIWIHSVIDMTSIINAKPQILDNYLNFKF